MRLPLSPTLTLLVPRGEKVNYCGNLPPQSVVPGND
jgi:hypothetical protein